MVAFREPCQLQDLLRLIPQEAVLVGGNMWQFLQREAKKGITTN